VKAYTLGSFLAASALVAIAPAAYGQRRTNVSIQSTPPGATVRVDDAAPIGRTPLPRASLTRGAHRLFYSLDGYVPQHLDINVTARNRPFAVTLVQAGSIYVAADAEGSPIFLDGAPAGNVPGRINGVAPGQHIVEIRAEGMQPFRETVTVSSGSVASVSANLRPRVAPTGTVRVVVSNPNGPVPADVQVLLDGTPMTGTPPSSDQVQPGTHIVQVSANGFRSTRREVVIAAGQVQALAVDLEAAAATGGTVRVVTPTMQGIQVYLDGEILDGTPPQRGGVSPGRHSVRISAPGRETVTREIDVTAGQQSVVEITEAQMAAARGRIVVRSATPGSRVFVDGTEVGAAPYEADASLGEHAIVVRADGHAEQARTCSVAPGSPCELAFTLEVQRAPGVLRVAAISARGGRPVPNATVRINDGAPHPVGDIANVPAGEVRVVVEAPNYGPVTQSVVLEPGSTQQLNVSLTRSGPSGGDVARRRAGLSTFGAAPLVRGDAAFDAIGAFGAMPLEVRATLGFMPFGQLGPFLVDGGIAIRTSLRFYEFEIRSRQGVRLFNDTFAFGIEERFYGALGASGSNGVGGLLQFNASAQFNLTSDENVDEEGDTRTRVNRFGSFAITLNLGVEFNSDNLSTGYNPNLTPPGSSNALTLCQNVAPGTDALAMGASDCTLNTTVRPFLGGVIEFGIGRHLSAFAGLQYFLRDANPRVPGQTEAQIGDDNDGRRPVTTSFWDDAYRAIVRGGVTYKF